MYNWEKNQFKTVFYADTVFSLLYYLCLINKKQFDTTLFVVSDRLPKEIRSNLQNKYSYKYPTSYIERIEESFKIRSLVKYLVNNHEIEEVYGNDVLYYAPYFIKEFQFSVLEDGVMNYREDLYKYYDTFSQHLSVFQRCFWRLFNGPFYKGLGLDERIKKVLLTGISEVPKEIITKVEIKSLAGLWAKNDYKDHINKLFGFKTNEYNKPSYSLLVTQALSEDGAFSETEKIQLYKKILNDNESEGEIIIKPHPREVTNYDLEFNNLVMNSNIPMELFLLNGKKIDCAITLCSGAVLSCNARVVKWYGNLCTPTLKKHFKNIEYQEPNSFLS